MTAQAPQPLAESQPAESIQSALFAHLVMQHSSMAMTFMGKLPHPETGQPTVDIQAAKVFIDMLEMLEAKTKGNLTREEAGMLKQTLMTLQLAFVEIVDAQEKAGKTTPETSAAASPTTEKGTTQPPPEDVAKGAAGTPPTAATEEENRKKFSKKY